MKLSKTSRAVARHLLSGWNYESIARVLNVSPNTVKTACSTEILSETRQGSVLGATMYILRTPEALAYVMEIEAPK